MEQATSIRTQVVQRLIDDDFRHAKTHVRHIFVKRAAVATVGVNDEHFSALCCMLLDKARQLSRVAALIQHIAGDEQVKRT